MGATENILSGNIIGWYGNCTVQQQKALQKVVHAVERTNRSPLPALHDIYAEWCRTQALRITKDSSHCANKGQGKASAA